MDKFIVTGGNALKGATKISGAKNVALKALVAACLTDDTVTIENVPLISDFFVMKDIMEELGGKVVLIGHTAKITVTSFSHFSIPLDKAALARTSAMFIAPLLARHGEAIIPNPGGCRLGARPIDRTIDGIAQLGVDVTYHSDDGYFHATTKGLKGMRYRFEKNTHTGTETLILASVLAKGTTVLENAAEEPEIDDLIALLNQMGAHITRSAHREITVEGVDRLHGTTYRISPDRNEIVTFAIAALLTKGDLTILDAGTVSLDSFVSEIQKIGGGYEKKGNDMRFFYAGPLHATDITTAIYPGFMTDWQAPWAVLMTQAGGTSTIHETVFENKLGYAHDLKKMGAAIDLFNPTVLDREKVYNFNLVDDRAEYFHAVRITGPRQLHNAVLTTIDLRAGAAVVLAALAAKGTSSIFGIDKLDRGYENFDERIKKLGGDIKRVHEE